MEYSWSCVIIYVREYWVIIQVREREKHGRHHEYRLYELHCTTILSLQNTLLFKPVLSLYLPCNHFFSKFFLIINLCT